MHGLFMCLHLPQGGANELCGERYVCIEVVSGVGVVLNPRGRAAFACQTMAIDVMCCMSCR